MKTKKPIANPDRDSNASFCILPKEKTYEEKLLEELDQKEEQRELYKDISKIVEDLKYNEEW